MIASLGMTFLILALLSSLVSICSPITLYFRSPSYSYRLCRLGQFAQFSFITMAFLSLIYAFASSNFSIALVVEHSHSLKPMIYKISGSWGNHEGSMLLWLWELSLFSTIFYLRQHDDKKHKNWTIISQSVIFACFLSYLIYSSNPFIPIFPTPKDGMGLNPLLQDIGLAIHPPILYCGYVCCAVIFSITIATLIKGKFTNQLFVILKSWTKLAFCFLTLGIGLGSWWAYRELGWGGFWFWDPVENASLLPWFTVTALIHSLIISSKRNHGKICTILLALLSFYFSVLATFLVRSGILMSVHSFASDPSRGYFILILLTSIATISCLIFTLRAYLFASKSLTKTFSREGLMLFNVILLSYGCFTVAWGTLYPIFYQLFSCDTITVAAAYFNKTLVPITIPLLLLTATAPYLNWSNSASSSSPWRSKYLIPSLLLTIFVTCSFNYYLKLNLLSTSLVLVSSLVIISSLSLLAIKSQLSIQKLLTLPKSFLSMIISHIAFALLIFSITICTSNQQEIEQKLQMNHSLQINNYKVTLKAIDHDGLGKNYLIRTAKLYIDRNGNEIATLRPEIRFYPVEEIFTTESSIHSTIGYDLYAAMGEFDQETNSLTVRLYFKPLLNWIWISIIMLVIGGLFGHRSKSVNTI